MYFAGIAERHNMNNPAGLPAQWQRFQPHIGHIDGAIVGAAYGIVGEIADDRFEYVAAMEMRAGADAPPDLELVSVPALKWARFPHKGDLSTIRQTIGAGEKWLTANGYEASEAPYSFLEYYGPAFDGRSGSGDIEIWFGLKN
jgi:AraC family transcriptional regulator